MKNGLLINSGPIGYGIATVGLSMSLLMMGLEWLALQARLPVGLIDVNSLWFVALAVLGIAFTTLGIKMTTPVSDFFLGLMYLPVSLLFLAMMIWFYFFSGAHLTANPYNGILLFVSIGFLGIAVSKISNRGPAGLRNALSAPKSGTFAHSLRKFLLYYFLVGFFPLILFLLLLLHPNVR